MSLPRQWKDKTGRYKGILRKGRRRKKKKRENEREKRKRKRKSEREKNSTTNLFGVSLSNIYQRALVTLRHFFD